jgi:hypothetical protein
MTTSFDYVWFLVEHGNIEKFFNAYGFGYTNLIQPCQTALKEITPDDDKLRSIKCKNNIFLVECVDYDGSQLNSSYQYFVKVDTNTFQYEKFDKSWYSVFDVDNNTPVGKHLLICDVVYDTSVSTFNNTIEGFVRTMGIMTHTARYEEYQNQINALKQIIENNEDSEKVLISKEELDLFEKYFNSRSCPNKSFAEYVENVKKQAAASELEEKAKPTVKEIMDVLDSVWENYSSTGSGREIFEVALSMTAKSYFGTRKRGNSSKTKSEITKPVWNFFKEVSKGKNVRTADGNVYPIGSGIPGPVRLWLFNIKNDPNFRDVILSSLIKKDAA